MSASKNDPFKDFFRNVTLFRGQAMTLLDKTAQMDSLKSDFLPFYKESLHQLDTFFMNKFNLMDNSNIIQSLDLRPNSQKVYEDQEFPYPNLKKVKISKCEYLQKVLDTCKSQDENQKTVVLTNRSSLPLFDQKITVDLDTNKIQVEDDPNTLVYDISNNDNMKVEEVEEVDITQQIIKVPVEIINNNNKATPRHSIQFNKENLITSPKLVNTASQVINKPPESSAMTVRDMNIIETACKDIQSTFDHLESSQNKKDNLTKSLFNNFEQADNPSVKIGSTLPSDDKAFNQDLEELISSISTFQPPIVERKSSVKKISPEHKKSLVNTTYFTAPSDARQSNPGKISTEKRVIHKMASQETELESFYTIPEVEVPVEEFDDEEYNLSDYSDDSENPVYKFHEKFESDEKPKQSKMFELYNKIQINNNTNTDFGGLQKVPSLHEDSSSQHSGFEHSNSNNTMFHDYNYYLKQQENKSGLPTFGGSFFDTMERKMEQSPKKQANKVKRLYCNDKRVPLWASNLEEVEKTSKAQKSMFDANKIFGSFAVENLDLVEIFKAKSKRLLKARGSSANWRNDMTPPSNQKNLCSHEKSSNKKEYSSTKKVLEFKSFKKENFLRY